MSIFKKKKLSIGPPYKGSKNDESKHFRTIKNSWKKAQKDAGIFKTRALKLLNGAVFIFQEFKFWTIFESAPLLI